MEVPELFCQFVDLQEGSKKVVKTNQPIPTAWGWDLNLGGGNSNIFCFHPDLWGNDPILFTRMTYDAHVTEGA